MLVLNNIVGVHSPQLSAQCQVPTVIGSIGAGEIGVSEQSHKHAIYLPGALLCGSALFGVIAAAWLVVYAVVEAVMWLVKHL